MRGIEHIFFDLDHTLWDYNKSSHETLAELFGHLHLAHSEIELKDFILTFHKVNDHLWHLYNHGEIDRNYIKTNRFNDILVELDADPNKSEEASRYYLEHCSRKPYLLADAITALRFLSEKYHLHIITNGFTDSQNNKITSSGIGEFFKVVVTSESMGSKKPSPEIFYYSVEKAGADISSSVMIGDNPKTDIKGAYNIGMRSILYDPSGRKRSLADVSIQSHLELIKLF